MGELCVGGGVTMDDVPGGGGHRSVMSGNGRRSGHAMYRMLPAAPCKDNVMLLFLPLSVAFPVRSEDSDPAGVGLV
eukprot:7067942-Prorocentrum_lima.AAC.1